MRGVSRFAIVCLAAPLLSWAGSVVSPSLTVLVDFESPHSETSLRTMRASLNQLLQPSGIEVDVQVKSDLADHPQFRDLVIFKMKGSCSIESVAPPSPIYDERGPLAMAYTSDGDVLHFGEVECDRIRHSLQRVLGHGVSIKNQQAYGSALAIVIAHEVYHMLGNVKHHTHEGLTKPELSALELTNAKLSMSHDALLAIQRSLHTELP